MTHQLPASRCPALLLLAAALFCAAPSAAQEAVTVDSAAGAQDNVVIVLDASGSMNDPMRANPSLTRMQAAKQALLRLVDDEGSLPATTNVGLLVFSGANIPSEWVYPLGKVDRNVLRQAVNLPQPDGATPLGEYLKKGADRLLAQRNEQHGYGTFRLLVVSDGEANDQHLVDLYLPDILGRGVTVNVIGVDMLADHALATRVHSYQRADDPQALATAVSKVFAEIGGDQQTVADEQEMFDMIQPLPVEMVEAMVGALTQAGNHPIGERPGNPPADGTGTPGTPAAYPGPAPQASGSSWGGAVVCVGGLLCVGALAVIFALVRFLARRGGRT